MKIIGLTGRSGCGKSSVMGYLSQKGYPFSDADEIAREVLLPGSPCLPALQNCFGSDIVDGSGTLQRRLLGDRAFATKDGTEALTAITFPEIVRRVRLAAMAARDAGAALFFVDGAVIIGTPFERECDVIIAVVSPYEESVRRICARDGITQAMARRRLDAQMAESTICAAAAYTIHNDGTFAQLIEQTQMVLTALLKEDYGRKQP